jgi:GT2 family glycosyltransferase
MNVSVVLPNWNGAHLLRKHLPYVLTAAPKAEIIVADDTSSDDSVKLLREKFPRVKVVRGRTRQGFAGNVNRGVAKATGEIIVLLNTDVRPRKDFLAPLLTHFRDPDVFAVGCLEESHDPGGVVLRGRGIGRWRKGYFLHERGDVTKADTAWIAGGSGAFRKSMWDELGGMDPLFNPFYWEDIDLSYRALKAGWKIIFESKSVVGHFHEEGKIKSEFTPADVARFAYRNQFIFIWKNLSDPWVWLAHLLWMPVRVVQAIVRGDKQMLMGLAAALIRLPKITAARQVQSKKWRVSDRVLFPASFI